MKIALISVLLFSVSVSWCQIEYQPIAGELLEYWNKANSSCFSEVWDSDSIGLPNGINDPLLTGIDRLHLLWETGSSLKDRFESSLEKTS